MPSPSSLAHPKRLVLCQDPDGSHYHELGGVRLDRGALLLLQLNNETWIPGLYEWDGEAWEHYNPEQQPLFKMFLADPFEKTENRLLSVSFYLPTDAVLRIHPKWKRITNPPTPRKPRNRDRSSTP
jgi:hypothetical protein